MLESEAYLGTFTTPPAQLKTKLEQTSGLLFDWDGVFNDGTKGAYPSTFNEVDSMGINMLRFGLYLRDGKIPFTAIVTGQNNEVAYRWAQREHLDAVFSKVKYKKGILKYLEKQAITPNEILFCFDDIIDLSLAEVVGTRWLIGREANPFFLNYVVEHAYSDYITKQSGGAYALREISETALNLLGIFAETVSKRSAYYGDYETYFQKRQAIQTAFYSQS